MRDVFQVVWIYATAALGLLYSLVTSGHAIIYKRDSRAAVGWVGLIWLAPLIGPTLYLLFGINRLRRRASGLRGNESERLSLANDVICPVTDLPDYLPPDSRHVEEMAQLNQRLTDMALLKGNFIEVLHNGDEAYPAMLEAIARAERSISLATYIFDNDAAGRLFVDAVAEAAARGVEVRVLIDAVGARYSIPPVTQRLRQRGVKVARFMPSLVPWFMPYLNLRNHRKILVIDGQQGFTGGMNIRMGNCLAEGGGGHPIRDTHFRVTGPVVHELQAVFAEDWQFTTGERLDDECWFGAVPSVGNVIARAIPDGPDHYYDKMRMAFHGALSVAHRRVRIVTPYFLPDAALIGALNTCALRGVEVDIILPRHNNQRLVAWAAMAQMWQILEWGCRVWLTPLPFDHSKFMVMDNMWCMIGSANWDPRSLRLNFELGLECYDTELATHLDEEAEARIADAVPLRMEDVNRRSLPVKLRDGLARLFAPYL